MPLPFRLEFLLLKASKKKHLQSPYPKQPQDQQRNNHTTLSRNQAISILV